MPDPIWVDMNVAQYAVKGSVAMEAELKAFREAGHELLMVSAANSELLNNNPLTMKGKKPVWEQSVSAGQKVAFENALDRLGIKVDKEWMKVPMSKRVGYNMLDHVPLKKGQKFPPALENISDSDRLVMSQIKASAEARGIKEPVMFTAEQGNKAMISQAHNYGIKVITPKGKPPAPILPPGNVPPANAPPHVPPANVAKANGPKPPAGGAGPVRTAKINLSDYPPDREGLIVRFFKDRPALQKAGVVAGSLLLEVLKAKLFETLQEHYAAALENASREFYAKCPSAFSLVTAARIDQHRKAYEEALVKLRGPSAGDAIVGSLMVALAPDKDQAAVARHVVDRVSAVRLANDQLGGVGSAGSAYVNAMADVYEQLTKCGQGLPAVAEDISRRGSVLLRCADQMQDWFWSVNRTAGFIPFVYYQTLDILTGANILKDLGAGLERFGDAIRARANEYESQRQKLDQELVRVSEQLGRLVP